MDIGTFLNQKFLEYEREIGRQSDFMEYIQHLNTTTGSHLIYGNVVAWRKGSRSPAMEGVRELVKAFGPGVLAMTGILSSEALLQFILDAIDGDDLTENQKEQLTQAIEHQAQAAREKRQAEGQDRRSASLSQVTGN